MGQNSGNNCLKRRLRQSVTLLLVSALLSDPVLSYPWLWVDPDPDMTVRPPPDCLQHPDGPYGGHPGITPDSNISILVQQGGAAATAVCPGSTYDVLVSFGGEKRHCMITATYGEFYTQTEQGTDPTSWFYPVSGDPELSCPNRVVSLFGAQHTNQLTIPCNAAGDLVIRVTAAFASFANLGQAQVTIPLSATCTSTCGDTGGNINAEPPPLSNPPPLGQISRPPPAVQVNFPPPLRTNPPPVSSPPTQITHPPPVIHSPPPVNQPSPTASPPASTTPPVNQHPPPSNARPPSPQILGSPPSPPTTRPPTPRPMLSLPPPPNPVQQVGGQCQSSGLGYLCAVPFSSFKLHYSLGGRAPANNCTGRTVATAAANSSLSPSPTQMLHMAIEAKTTGWIGLGFAGPNFKMAAADVILGWVTRDDKSFVNTYQTDSTDLGPGDARPWTMDMGVAKTADGTTIVCFTRMLQEPRAQYSQTLDPRQDLHLIWATSSVPKLVQHDEQGGLAINLLTHSFTEVSVGIEYIVRWHGILAAVSCALLLPFGTLLPRHRWVLGETHLCGKALWFLLHVFSQTIGLGMLIAAFALAWHYFPKPDSKLNTAHQVGGTIVFCLFGIQFLWGLSRPGNDAKNRERFNRGHRWLGRTAVLCSWAVVVMGISLFHNTIYKADFKQWLPPAAAAMGAVLLLDLLLTACRPRQMISMGTRKRSDAPPRSSLSSVPYTSRFAGGFIATEESGEMHAVIRTVFPGKSRRPEQARVELHPVRQQDAEAMVVHMNPARDISREPSHEITADEVEPVLMPPPPPLPLLSPVAVTTARSNQDRLSEPPTPLPRINQMRAMMDDSDRDYVGPGVFISRLTNPYSRDSDISSLRENPLLHDMRFSHLNPLSLENHGEEEEDDEEDLGLFSLPPDNRITASQNFSSPPGSRTSTQNLQSSPMHQL